MFKLQTSSCVPVIFHYQISFHCVVYKYYPFIYPVFRVDIVQRQSCHSIVEYFLFFLFQLYVFSIRTLISLSYRRQTPCIIYMSVCTQIINHYSLVVTLCVTTFTFCPKGCVYVLNYSKYSDYFHIQHWLVFIAETKRVH